MRFCYWCSISFLLPHILVVPTRVGAFPNHAGGCYAGPAVSGLHISNSNNNNDGPGRWTDRAIDFYVDGTLVPYTPSDSGESTPLAVSVGVEHVLELVSAQPFAGVLMRVESNTANFVLQPLINAQIAVECGDDSATTTTTTTTVVQGVSHTSRRRKNAFSASFTATNVPTDSGSIDDFVVDITVVDYNNATGSVYWYAQFHFVTTSTPTPTPTVSLVSPTAIPTVAYKRTASPTLTSFPTYHDRCMVCGKNDNSNVMLVVRRPNQRIVVLDESATCGELEQDGATGLIPSALCGLVQEVARANCDCGTRSVETAEPMIPTAATAAVMSPDNDNAPTTVLAVLYPHEKCYVCGVNGQVTRDDRIVTVGDATGTCSALQEDGQAGYLSYDLCRAAIRTAVVQCGCARLAVPSPRSSSSSQSSALATPSAASTTMAPSITPYPTVTAYPSFVEKCHVCGDQGMQVTAPNQIVSVRGDVGTCQDLERQGALGFVNPSLCTEAIEVAIKRCRCAFVPSTPHTTVKTFTPTVTPFPTVSFNPTFSVKCLVCGHGKRPSLLDAVIEVDNLALTCRELATAGRENEIPPKVCPEAQSVAQASCGCRRYR